MHNPTLLTPVLAQQVIQDHVADARIQRVSRRGRLSGRRRAASRILAPRGRLAPPVAH